MRSLIAIRGALVAFALIGVGLATAAYADVGSIRFNVVKAGFVIGGSAGSGAMNYHGRIYPLIIGGVSYGFTFGGSLTDFVGTVTNIRTPSDVNGIYVAGGAALRSVSAAARSCWPIRTAQCSRCRASSQD